MAHPGDLVRTLAEVLGVDQATVAQHDRALAKAKLRHSGGRGRSAARMSAQDAASLLLAVLAPSTTGPTVRETTRTFSAYSRLRAHLSGEEAIFADNLGDWYPLVFLRDLPRGHSLLSALTSLISGFMSGHFDDAGRVWGTDIARQSWGGNEMQPPLAFDAMKAIVRVRVTFAATDSQISSTIHISSPNEQNQFLHRELEYRSPKLPISKSPKKDLIQTKAATISDITFRAIAKLLNEHPAVTT